MKNNSKLLNEICKEVISEMVKNGFYENNLSKKQLKKLKEIKEKTKDKKRKAELKYVPLFNFK